MTDATANPTTPLSARRRPLVVAILTSFGLLFTGCGVVSIYIALCPDTSIAGRILMSALAATCFFLPGTIAVALIRRKLTTGRWTLTQQERIERLRKIAAKPPSLASRMISSPWFNRTLNLLMIALAGINIWSAHRNGFRPFDLTIAAIWIGIAALSIWQMSRRRRSIA